jgi:hypothetical protein
MGCHERVATFCIFDLLVVTEKVKDLFSFLALTVTTVPSWEAVKLVAMSVLIGHVLHIHRPMERTNFLGPAVVDTYSEDKMADTPDSIHDAEVDKRQVIEEEDMIHTMKDEAAKILAYVYLYFSAESHLQQMIPCSNNP